jgi:hypothetical protein
MRTLIRARTGPATNRLSYGTAKVMAVREADTKNELCQDAKQIPAHHFRRITETFDGLGGEIRASQVATIL